VYNLGLLEITEWETCSQLFALQTLVFFMRFHNWVPAIGIKHFVNRNYWHPLTFDI